MQLSLQLWWCCNNNIYAMEQNLNDLPIKAVSRVLDDQNGATILSVCGL